MELCEVERYRQKPVPVIHKMSFGKDSYATLLALIEGGIKPHVVLYNDTGWEALEHYDYLAREKERLLSVYGIDTVTTCSYPELAPERLAMAEDVERIAGFPGPSAMVRNILAKDGFFPRPGRGGGGGKWCTHTLKILPGHVWLEDQDFEPDPIMTTGVRAEESVARSGYPAWEKQHNRPYLWEWRPLLRATVEDVGEILTRHGIPRHPLYLAGTSRVGCWPCIHIAKAELEVLGRDTRRVAAVKRLEEYVSQIRGEENSFLQAKSKPEGMEFYPPVPIEQAIMWSSTARGGK